MIGEGREEGEGLFSDRGGQGFAEEASGGEEAEEGGFEGLGVEGGAGGQGFDPGFEGEAVGGEAEEGGGDVLEDIPRGETEDRGVAKEEFAVVFFGVGVGFVEVGEALEAGERGGGESDFDFGGRGEKDGKRGVFGGELKKLDELGPSEFLGEEGRDGVGEGFAEGREVESLVAQGRGAFGVGEEPLEDFAGFFVDLVGRRVFERPDTTSHAVDTRIADRRRGGSAVKGRRLFEPEEAVTDGFKDFVGGVSVGASDDDLAVLMEFAGEGGKGSISRDDDKGFEEAAGVKDLHRVDGELNVSGVFLGAFGKAEDLDRIDAEFDDI